MCPNQLAAQDAGHWPVCTLQGTPCSQWHELRQLAPNVPAAQTAKHLANSEDDQYYHFFFFSVLSYGRSLGANFSMPFNSPSIPSSLHSPYLSYLFFINLFHQPISSRQMSYPILLLVLLYHFKSRYVSTIPILLLISSLVIIAAKKCVTLPLLGSVGGRA